MKSTILKLALPVAAFVLASAGAVSTSSKDSALVDLQGYRQTTNPLQPCESVKMCSDTGSNFCTVDDSPTGIRLWHREDDESPCNIALYRIQ